ncbi:hypothetical protein [Microvirga aerilata]|uniref:hypothetical protein n=1 Tax=Microvirga aerilata TaxID=670292 RepID=UPI001AEDE307|nr:hypothetical protein [Microvirga aerilata]
MAKESYAHRGLGSKGCHDQRASLTPSVSSDEADTEPLQLDVLLAAISEGVTPS